MAFVRESLLKMGRSICLQARNVFGRISDIVIDCKGSHSSAAQIPSSHRFPSLRQNRHLSLSDQNFFKSNPTCNKIHRLDCVGSVEDWLIMVDNEFRNPTGFSPFCSCQYLLHNLQTPACFATLNFFLNPKSGDRVILPSQSTIPCHGSNQPSFFKKVVASSAPTSPHCVVAALCSHGGLALCRPTDESWTLIDDHNTRGVDFRDIEIIDGKLYAQFRKAPEYLVEFKFGLDANGPPAYSAGLFILEPVSIPSNITTRDEMQRYSISKQLFKYTNIFLPNYGIDLEEDPKIPWSEIIGGDHFVAPPKTVGFRAGFGHETVFKQNCINTTSAHRTQFAAAQPPGLLCFVK